MQKLEIKNVDCHATLAMTKNAQSGRSMIEMLGVLAIIGVLSVGGIAGYSKAMQKYRINKTIEQITLIAGNVRTFFAPQKNYEGLDVCRGKGLNVTDSTKAACELIKKAKLMPDEMWDDTIGEFVNLFGGTVNLYTAHKSTNADTQAFSISYGIHLDNEEICIELLSYDWTNAGVKGIFIPSIAKLTPPVSVDSAVAKCSDLLSFLKSISASGIAVSFYFDVNSNCWSETNGNTCS